jgi:hypothetical protein
MRHEESSDAKKSAEMKSKKIRENGSKIWKEVTK